MKKHKITQKSKLVDELKKNETDKSVENINFWRGLTIGFSSAILIRLILEVILK